MAKLKGETIRKTTFGVRKKGKAKKSFNKHDSKNSLYHKRNASR